MATKKTRTAAALARRDRAQSKAAEAVAALHEAIVDDLDDGVTQQELKDITGYSRERLRLIAKAVRDRRAQEEA